MSLVEMLAKKSAQMREELLNLDRQANAGHPASALSCVDILVALYYGDVMLYDSKNPKWEERDIFILGKGHAVDALYPILADVGYFTKEELLAGYCKGTSFGIHPDAKVPGIEMVTGSLGHALGVACGIALGFKLDKKTNRVFVLLGDGECYEGSVWEAAMFASQHKLDNLIAIVDRNNLTTIDFTENYLRLNPLLDKWQDFGWSCFFVNGNSPLNILNTLKLADSTKKPMVVIAETIKGRGVPELENNPMGHTTIPK